jgi:hypothetical protein
MIEHQPVHRLLSLGVPAPQEYSRSVAPVSVRPLNVSDLPSLGSVLQAQVPLNYPQAVLDRRLSGLLAVLPYGRRYRQVFVAESDGGLSAFAEFQLEPWNYRWTVARLGARLPEPEGADEDLVQAWGELLRYAGQVAGASGVKRLAAAAPTDGPVYDSLRQVGFTPYAQETILLAQGLHAADSGHAVVREQEPSDAWSIHQLYHLATPRAIQYADAFTSNHWDIGRRAGLRVRGFLIEREQEIMAYCQVTSRGHRHVIDVLVQEGEPHLLQIVVPTALARVGVGDKDAIWVGIPDYHVDYLAHLEHLGFRPIDRLSLTVKYTAVPAEVHDLGSVVVPTVIESLPARAPSYSSIQRTAR